MRKLTLVLASILLSASTSDAEACGDKFLRVGRGARYQRAYVAVHPASLLLVARPGSSVAAALKELEPTLKRAGHKSVVVKDASAVAGALDRGQFNIVLADLKDVPTVEGATTRTNGARVDVLPFVEQPTSAARAAVEGDFHCVAEVPGKKTDVLGKIDELMELALKGTGESNRKRP
jgi:hypothetical protein